MTIDTKRYADGTFINRTYPFGLYRGAKALCSDGRVRVTRRIAETADTFYSVPASVTVKGKSVAGYITVESREGLSTPSKSDPLVVKFFAYKYRKNAGLLP